MKNRKILFGFAAFLIFFFAPLFSMSDAAVNPAQKSPPKTAPRKPAPAPRKTEPKTPQKLQEEAEKAPAATPSPDTIPQARIEEAELAFTRAWEAFIQRDYWQAIAQLNRAQAANIFLVDVYFLRGLVQRKMGELDGAQKSIAGFLEVRARDETAPYVLQQIAENKADMSALISRSPYPENWSASLVDLYSVLKLSYNRPYSAKGFGKLRGFASSLCFADTIGNDVFLRGGEKTGAFLGIAVGSPIVSLLPGDNSVLVITMSGDIHQIINSKAEIFGSLKNTTVSDAAYVFTDEIIVADPINRRVTLFSFPALEAMDAWEPAEKADFLFEPAAVSCYGEWAAIADRGNGRIYFLNLLNYTSFHAKEDSVRDVMWGKLGSLVSVNEKNEIAVHVVDFSKKTSERKLLHSGAQDAWGLFGYEGEIYCSNVMGTKFWQIKSTPNLAAPPGYLSIYSPNLGTRAESESLTLSATLMTPFQSWAAQAPITAMSVWNDNVITASIGMISTGPAHGIIFGRGVSEDSVGGTRLIQAADFEELKSKLSSVWTGQRDLLTNIIVDSRIVSAREDIIKLTAFCMFNGIQLDIWEKSIPSVELMRASGATGGNVYYSLSGKPQFYRQPYKLKTQSVIPYKSAASGYSDRAALSMYVNIGQMSARDWMPLWIDLLTK